jgi:CHRD domain
VRVKSRRLVLVSVLAVLLGSLVLALPALAGGALATLETNLTGEQEVPGPGDPDGSGHAVVKVFKTKVCYTLKVERIAPATAAHIHLGLRGEAGPVVATLKPPTDGSSRACTEIPRALSLELIEHPARYYVNVHNDPFPDGAIRGQLHR